MIWVFCLLTNQPSCKVNFNQISSAARNSVGFSINLECVVDGCNLGYFSRCIACFVGISYFPEHYRFYGTRNELRNYSLVTQQRKFLFAALRRFVLGAAKLVVFRLVGFFWRRDSLAGCSKWQRVVGCVREVFKATV